jgi:hypothetical protein
MLRFSKANAKLQQLSTVQSITKYLGDKKRVYSLDLLSGWSCPFANDCLSKVHVINGSKKIVDGPNTEFRCFSASQEVLFPALYNLRKHNFDTLRKLSHSQMVDRIEQDKPHNMGVCRIHVGGDMFSEAYFLAWCQVAKNNPNILFYAYTKSLNYWIKNANLVNSTSNFILTASFGGRLDHLIRPNRLRYSRVVFNEGEAEQLSLEIDHNDSAAADPEKRDTNFALLVHGVQPKGSAAGEAIKIMKRDNVKFAYGRNSKNSVTV